MIVVYGDMRVRADHVVSIAELARRFVEQVHKEEGCLAYELSWDVADPQRLRLLENWVDDVYYEAHRVQSHVREWATAITAAQETKIVTTKLVAVYK